MGGVLYTTGCGTLVELCLYNKSSCSRHYVTYHITGAGVTGALLHPGMARNAHTCPVFIRQTSNVRPYTWQADGAHTLGRDVVHIITRLDM